MSLLLEVENEGMRVLKLVLSKSILHQLINNRPWLFSKLQGVTARITKNDK